MQIIHSPQGNKTKTVNRAHRNTTFHLDFQNVLCAIQFFKSAQKRKDRKKGVGFEHGHLIIKKNLGLRTFCAYRKIIFWQNHRISFVFSRELFAYLSDSYLIS